MFFEETLVWRVLSRYNDVRHEWTKSARENSARFRGTLAKNFSNVERADSPREGIAREIKSTGCAAWFRSANDSRSIYAKIKHPFQLPSVGMESRKVRINSIRSAGCRWKTEGVNEQESSVTAIVRNCSFLSKLPFAFLTRDSSVSSLD